MPDADKGCGNKYDRDRGMGSRTWCFIEAKKCFSGKLIFESIDLWHEKKTVKVSEGIMLLTKGREKALKQQHSSFKGQQGMGQCNRVGPNPGGLCRPLEENYHGHWKRIIMYTEPNGSRYRASRRREAGFDLPLYKDPSGYCLKNGL